MKTICFALSAAVGIYSGGCGAHAADLQPSLVELPPISADLHGFSDTSFKNDYITPRGLLVTNRGATLQSVDILEYDLYKNPNSAISGVSVTGGTFFDINPGYRSPNTNAFNEVDYIGGATVKFGQAWTVSAQYLQFDSPQNAFFVERNAEVTLKYDDSAWNRLLPLNSYARFFYTFKGKSSTVVTGDTATFDVELGAIPSYDLKPRGLPIVLTLPTWVTVGPSRFWGGASNFGVFSTGLVATMPLPSLPPALSAAWTPHLSIHAGVQYYRILNDRLLLAQTLVGTAGAATHRDVVVPSIGLAAAF